MADPLLEPLSLGRARLPNRIVRAATSESMAALDGSVTPQLVELYRQLAAGDVGLILTGHLYCDERGKYANGQTGIHDDALLPGLGRLVKAVHAEGGTIFAQVAHAGSQSRVPGVTPLAPSPVPNPLTGERVEEASPAEVDAAVAAFAAAARRAVAAGFDGVHIHGANGYLISEFASPVTNRREDGWGGSATARDAFPRAVARAVRDAVGPDLPVTMKIGIADAVPGGVQVDESVARAARLVSEGIDAIEVSCGLMAAPTDSAKQYVAVTPARALRDWLLHRVLSPPHPQAYFRPWAQAVKRAVDVPVILVGGLRSPAVMRDVIVSGDADLVALARPFIREPDLVRRIAAGREEPFACTSCNLCLLHEGHHSLRCWRTPRRRLLEHAAYLARGGFRRAPVRPVQRHR